MLGVLLFVALAVAEVVRYFKSDETFDGIMLFARPVVVLIAVMLCGGTFWYALIGAVAWGVIGFVISMVTSEGGSQPDEAASSVGAKTIDDTTKTPKQSSTVSMENGQTAALIDEAVGVIQDMLEVGEAARFVSFVDYEGFITTAPDARPPFQGNTINYGFCINMTNVSDLEKCRDRHPRMRANPESSLMMVELDHFSQKYQSCYDSVNERYTYVTRRTVPLKANSSDRQRLSALLYEQVKKRCPLADFNGVPIHTKNVPH